jgi:hypothetical protein
LYRKALPGRRLIACTTRLPAALRTPLAAIAIPLALVLLIGIDP